MQVADLKRLHAFSIIMEIELGIPYKLEGARVQGKLNLSKPYPITMYLTTPLQFFEEAYEDYRVETSHPEATVVSLFGVMDSWEKLYVPRRLSIRDAEGLLQKDARERLLKDLYVLEIDIASIDSMGDFDRVNGRRTFPIYPVLGLPYGDFSNSGNVIVEGKTAPFDVFYAGNEWFGIDEPPRRGDPSSLVLIDPSSEVRVTFNRIQGRLRTDQETIDRTQL